MLGLLKNKCLMQGPGNSWEGAIHDFHFSNAVFLAVFFLEPLGGLLVDFFDDVRFVTVLAPFASLDFALLDFVGLVVWRFAMRWSSSMGAFTRIGTPTPDGRVSTTPKRRLNSKLTLMEVSVEMVR